MWNAVQFRASTGEYLPLEGYELIGTLDTCALVNRDGPLDWYPAPHLESPSVFARLLDAEIGGHFTIRPAATYETSQAYLDWTKVLRTTFSTGIGTLSLVDFMPVEATGGTHVRRPAIHRSVACEQGRSTPT